MASIHKDGHHNLIRTLGDGMDNNLLKLTELTKNSIIKPNYKLSNEILNSLKPVQPKSPLIYLTPKYVPKERKQPKCLIRKPKEPKFIPYEPYKAAVHPILPHLKETIKIINQKTSKNNIDIQDLVTQMTDMRKAEMNKAKIEAINNEDEMISKKQWEAEKSAYETDIKNLRETNAHLENQLKFQAQVNGELKTLLVAAVGEDLETRVQHLTEDKLQLARALLNSANHLTSHQEQTEWLSGQCEVWRSKFLASSLMVEELARWKSSLTKRINELHECIKCILEERTKVRKYALKTYSYLSGISKSYNIESVPLQSSNIVDLGSANLNICKNIYRHLVSDNILNENMKTYDIDESILEAQYTFGENIALRVMQSTVVLVNKPDSLSNSLIGAAMSLSAGQLCMQTSKVNATCCAHCTGEVQNI